MHMNGVAWCTCVYVCTSVFDCLHSWCKNAKSEALLPHKEEEDDGSDDDGDGGNSSSSSGRRSSGSESSPSHGHGGAPKEGSLGFFKAARDEPMWKLGHQVCAATTQQATLEGCIRNRPFKRCASTAMCADRLESPYQQIHRAAAACA